MTDNCSNCKNRADCKAVEALAEMHRRFGTPPKCNAYEPSETIRETEKEFMQRIANAFGRAFGTGDAQDMIEDAPAADVALRAEIAAEIFADLQEMLIPEKSDNGTAYYFDVAELAELKKKYTEELDNG